MSDPLQSGATTRTSRRRSSSASGVAMRSQARARPPRAPRPAALPFPGAPGAGALAGAGAGLGVLLGPLMRAAAALAGRVLRHPDAQRALGGAVLLGGLALASTGVRAEVESWPRFMVEPARLAADGLPPELGPRARADLTGLPLPARTSSFDPRLVGWVQACLQDLPWVESVERVWLGGPDRIDFALRPRLPRARLGEGPEAPIVTADGAVIPAAYAADPEALPRLLGVPGPQRPTPRREALLAGLAVLEAVRGVDLPLAAVDLANLGGAVDPRQSEVVLRTRDGLAIEWGRVEGPRPHLPPERQRQALQTFLAARGGLPAVERVSLRWDRVTYTLAAPAGTPTPAQPMRASAARR